MRVAEQKFQYRVQELEGERSHLGMMPANVIALLVNQTMRRKFCRQFIMDNGHLGIYCAWTKFGCIMWVTMSLML